jgi:hypothetical protein
MSKQTAVNQIFAQIKAGRKDTKFWNDTMVIDWLFEAEEWLKKMEKEQIVDAYTECWMNDGGNGFHKVKEAESYYNETYGDK